MTSITTDEVLKFFSEPPSGPVAKKAPGVRTRKKLAKKRLMELQSIFDRSLTELSAGNSEPWCVLIRTVLDLATAGNDAYKSRLIEICVDRPTNANVNSGLEFLVQECLERLNKGDTESWQTLQEFTFQQLVRKCEAMVRHRLSKDNPLITGNSLAAEVYMRLNKAIMENKTALPKTAAEYFGLAGRNIRWQLTDMLRKPTAQQGGTSLFEEIAMTTGVGTSVEDMGAWEKFWHLVNELPEDQRTVFDLLWIHELSQYEAAKMLGVSRDRVKDIWRDIRLHIVKNCSEMAGQMK